MTVKVKQPTLDPLDKDELTEINGGASETGSVSMTMSSSADSLVSMDLQWQQGDRSKEYKLSVGNNVDLNLNAYGNGTNVS